MPRAYEFGPYRLEVDLRQLLRDDEVMALTPKAFDTLLALVRRRDRVVDKDELMKIVWPDSFVSEDSLTQSISVLRRVLGDVTNQPQFILTIPRRGYRFNAPVVEIRPAPSTGHHRAESSETSTPNNIEARPARTDRSRSWISAIVVVSALAALGLVVRALLVATPPAAGPLRFVVNPPEGVTVVTGGALSPDGRHLAFVATDASKHTKLWIRDLDASESRSLPGTEGAFRPFWSPDSRFIGFFAGAALKKVDLTGDAPLTIAKVSPTPAGGSWGAGGTILFADRLSALFSVSASGGDVTPATRLDAGARERRHRWPQFLPDGRHFLYSVISDEPDHSGTYVGLLGSPDHQRLLDGPSPAVYAPPGYLLYVRDRALMAQSFDAGRLRLVGEPVAVASQVTTPQMMNGAVISAAGGGILSFGGGAGPGRLTWFNRAGQPLAALDAPGAVSNPTLSPDQKQLLVQVQETDSTGGVWLVDLLNTAWTRVAADSSVPLWSPDGTRIAFTSAQFGGIDDIFVQPAAGGAAELLLRTAETKHVHAWSPDGRYIVYIDTNPRTKIDLWLLPTFGDRKPIPFLRTPANELQGQISPDGRWIAYASDESGVWEVYVQPFPAPGGSRRTISLGGGAEPQWRPDGRELFYLAPDHTLMAVQVTPGATWRADSPHALFRANVPDGAMPRNHYAVTADGERFVMNAVDAKTSGDPMTVVVNWTAK